MSPTGWRRVAGALFGLAFVRSLLRVLGRYGAAGGALMAGGLAYSALFAIVPMALVTVGLTGLLVGDLAVRNDVVRTIAEVLPPLRGILEAILDEAAKSAATVSVVGVATLVWGGSRFILAFEDAMSRMTGGPRTRSALVRNAIGIAAAIVLVLSIVLGAILAGVAAFLDAAVAQGGFVAVSTVTQFVLAILPIGLTVGAMVLVFRFVPESRPSWRASALPALVIGIVLTITVRVFVFLAPRLIGAAAAIGTLATAFAALAWLGLTFQAILLGASWVGLRNDAEVERSATPR